MFWITVDQIQCFQTVVETGSFTKAAENLNRAKSAVIYSVKTLKNSLASSCSIDLSTVHS